MAFVNSRLVAGLIVGIGLGAVVARRRAAVQEPCCDPPSADTGTCC